MGIARAAVYFAYLGDEATEAGLVAARLSYMAEQLRWLAGLIAASDETIEVLVPYVAPVAWDREVERLVALHGFRVDPPSSCDDRRNRFEYPGFRTLQRIAQSADPERLLFYCHSKGIVHLEEEKLGLFKLHTQTCLTADLSALVADPRLTKAGLFPYRFGWCWYNIFWIKAGRMADIAVAEADDRYHFEALIGVRGDKEGFRSVLPLIGQVPFDLTAIGAKPWYRPEETTTPTLAATYRRIARAATPKAGGLG